MSSYSIADCSNFPHFKRKFFHPYQEAQKQGYFSKSFWKKKGREVIDADEPALAVAGARISSRPYDDEIILADNGFRYLLTTEKYNSDLGKKCSWPVYSTQQTRPRVKKKRSSRVKSGSPRAASSPAELGGEAAQLALEEEDFVILDGALPTVASSASSSPSSSLLLPSIPIDRRDFGQIDATTSDTNDLPVINRRRKPRERVNSKLKNESPEVPGNGFVILDDLDVPTEQSSLDSKPRLRPAKGRRVEHRGLMPTAFTEADWDKINGFEEEFAVFCWRMIWFRTIKEQGTDDWIDMAYDWCEANIPRWRDLRKLLLAERIVDLSKIVEADISGVVHVEYRGKDLGRAYGYRLADPSYRRDYHTVELTKPSVTKYLSGQKKKSPVVRWLEDQLRRLQVVDWDEGYLERLAEKSWAEHHEGTIEGRQKRYRTTLEWIRDGVWYFEPDDFSGRLHTNLTALKKETRKYLRVDGKPLAQCDLPNSQPMFLAAACRETKYHDPRFFDICQSGGFYEYLEERGKWSRDEVKDQFTRKALFAPNDHPYQELPVKRLFDAEFPLIAEYMRKQKYGRPKHPKDKPHNKLARRLQRKEITLILTACDKIRRKRPDMFLATIHDSLCFQIESGDYVKHVMKETLAKSDLHPTLDPEVFA